MKDKHILLWAGAIVLAALLRSLDGTFLRPQFYSLPAELVVFLEHSFGSLIFLWFVISGWKQIRQMSWRWWWSLFRVSIFGGILWTVFITKAFFLAIDGSISFATVIILQKLQAVFALIIAALLLKERLQKSFYLRAIIAIGAAYILAFWWQSWITISINRQSSGAIFALLAAFAFWSSTVFSKQLTQSLDAKRSAGMRFITVSILIGIYLLFAWTFPEINLVSPTQRTYLMIIALSSGWWALFLYYYGLKYIQASQATIMELARPLSAVFLDRIINGNMLTWTQRIATIILLIAMIQIAKREKIRSE